MILFLEWIVNLCDNVASFIVLGVFAIVFIIYASAMVIGYFFGFDLGPKDRLDD